MFSTPNYLFNTSKQIKKSSHSSIYVGKNKNNGLCVFVKCYLPNYSNKFWKIKREIELLKKLKHENIVRFIDSEIEVNCPEREMLILDYCSEGSLQTKLLETKNKFGLIDCEYLELLKCLKNGMQYLHNNHICHRDIQPDNIMVHKSKSGQIIYKLDNFSHAKQLKAGGSFNSIAGTEEYMSPAMYRVAVLNEPNSAAFNSLVDLWSVGVTLFEAATNRLPFIPHDYKRCSESRITLCKMYMNKPANIISGIENGRKSFEWSESFPDKSAISSDLASLMTPLMRKLFELQSDSMVTFDQFFKEAEQILDYKVVRIFQPLCGDLRIAYLQLADECCSKETIDKIRVKVAQLWGTRDSFLFQSGQNLSNPTQILQTGYSSRPIISGSYVPQTDQEKAPPRGITLRILHLPSFGSVDAIIYFINDLISELSYWLPSVRLLQESVNLFDDYFNVFHTHIQDQFKSIENRMPHLMTLINSEVEFSKLILEVQTRLEDETQSLGGPKSIYGDEGFKEDLKKMSDNVKEAEKLRHQYDEKILLKCELRKRWKPPVASPDSDFSIEYYLNELEDILTNLPIYENSNNCDDKYGLQSLQLEGMRAHNIYETAVRNIKCLHQHVTNLCSHLHKWLTSASNVQQKFDKLATFNEKLEKSRLSTHKRSIGGLQDILQSSSSRFSSFMSGSNSHYSNRLDE